MNEYNNFNQPVVQMASAQTAVSQKPSTLILLCHFTVPFTHLFYSKDATRRSETHWQSYILYTIVMFLIT